MKAETATETTAYVLVKMTAEEARQLATSLLNGVEACRMKNLMESAKDLEILAWALGVALAQLPKEGE